jgi:hypothetical protein
MSTQDWINLSIGPFEDRYICFTKFEGDIACTKSFKMFRTGSSSAVCNMAQPVVPDLFLNKLSDQSVDYGDIRNKINPHEDCFGTTSKVLHWTNAQGEVSNQIVS